MQLYVQTQVDLSELIRQFAIYKMKRKTELFYSFMFTVWKFDSSFETLN